MAGTANIEGILELGGGAQFWVYISPQNNTPLYVTKWEVTIQQIDGNWSSSINSDQPHQQLKTPELSGVFKVTVKASGPNFPETILSPQASSKTDVGCNSNCAAMVGIVAKESCDGAAYWTVWDAMCKRT